MLSGPLCLLGLLTALFSTVAAEDFEDISRTRDDAHSGMVPLFDMMSFFLNDMVQSKTLGQLMTEYDIEKLSDFTDDEFLNDWDEWILYFLGLIICILVGILFVVVMPMCGCCYCCYNSCRCCCCCCKSKTQRPTKHAKRKRICYWTLVFCMSSLMLTGAIMVFVSNAMLDHEVRSTGWSSDLTNGLIATENYVHDTLDDVNRTLLQEVYQTTDEVIHLLESLPEDSLRAVEDEYQIGAMLYNLQHFTDNLGQLSLDYGRMINLTYDLRAEVILLDVELTSSRNSLGPLLDQCISTGASASCTTAEDTLHLVAPDATYQSIDILDAEQAKAAVDLAIAGGIEGEVQKAVDSYLDISDIVLNETAAETEAIIEAADEVVGEVEDYFDELVDTVDDLDFSEAYEGVDTMQDYLDEYAPYYVNSVWLLNSMILVIALCYLTGLAMGILLPKSDKDDGRFSCTTHQAANWLMSGISLTFIFSWLFMFLATLHFAIGGATETLLCRHLVSYDDTMVQLEEAAKLEAEMDYNISFKECMECCERDGALYEAANMENNGYNVTELLDLEQYGFYEVIEELTNVTVQLGDVNIVSEELNQTMLTLDAYLQAVDYDSYYEELNKDVTQTDLLDYATLLDGIVEDLNAEGEGDLADDIEHEAELLRNHHVTYVDPMESDRAALSEAVSSAQTITDSTDLTQLMLDLTASQNSLQEDGGDIITDVIVDYGDDIVDLVEGYADVAETSIRYDIGSCREMFEAGQSVVYGACVYFLEPLNAFWWCYGWFIFFAIPGLIFAAILAGLYREWSDNSVAPFDDDTEDLPPPYTENDDVNVEQEKQERPKSNQVAPLAESDVDGATSGTSQEKMDPSFNPDSFEISEKGGLDGW